MQKAAAEVPTAGRGVREDGIAVMGLLFSSSFFFFFPRQVELRNEV